MTVEGRDDVHELMEEWRTYVVRHALQAAAEAARMIDLEVAAVRTAGLSWTGIGKAGGALG